MTIAKRDKEYFRNTFATRAKSAGNNTTQFKKEDKIEGKEQGIIEPAVIAQEQGGLSILATRPKSAGTNKHDTKKERRRN